MSQYTSQPVPTIFNGVAQVPDKFIVNYRASTTGATIAFTGIDENGALVTLATGINLDSTARDARIIASAFVPIVGYYYVIDGIEWIAELNSIVMTTKHAVPVTQFAN